MTDTELRCSIHLDDIARDVARLFDYETDGTSVFRLPEMPHITDGFGIGLIVGPSGSGKSNLLRRFGTPKMPSWNDDLAIVSHFDSTKDAYEKLGAVGLNSIPSWLRPYHVLSTGEKFRADLARQLRSGAIIDEFTSVVDRNVAKSCACALRRYVDKSGIKNVVIASCHYDVIDWLQADWVFDTFTGRLTGRGSERRRPPIQLRIEPCHPSEWVAFRSHHYLNTSLNKSARCWLVTWGSTKVGFVSALSFPNKNFKNAWREHRTVVLPDFQGLGIGVAASDAVANMFILDGCRYFSKTAHPRFGEYRDNSPLWKPTSKNRRSRPDYSVSLNTKEDKHKMQHAPRVCYSHEYVGVPS